MGRPRSLWMTKDEHSDQIGIQAEYANGKQKQGTSDKGNTRFGHIYDEMSLK